MKKILSSLLLFISVFAKAQELHLQVGDKFVYQVKAGGSEYDFTLVIKTIAPDISFAWQMTNEDLYYGKLTIPAAAMMNSNKMFNYFSGGNKTLNGMTSVFLSRNTYRQIKSDNEFVLYDDKKKLTFHNDGRDGYTYNDNGDWFQCNYIRTKGDEELVVVDNPQFPLIVSMELGWSIKLQDYIPVDKTPVDLSNFSKKKITDSASAFLWKKVNRSAAVSIEDVSNVGDDKRAAVYKTYYAFIEGMMVETLNDTVIKILYYPQQMIHGSDRYYGASFPMTQIKDFSLNRIQQKKAIRDKFSKATLYDADSYLLKDSVIMEVYYSIPKKAIGGGMEFVIGKMDEKPAMQKAAFVTFE